MPPAQNSPPLTSHQGATRSVWSRPNFPCQVLRGLIPPGLYPQTGRLRLSSSLGLLLKSYSSSKVLARELPHVTGTAKRASVAQQVKDPALSVLWLGSLLWHIFSLWAWELPHAKVAVETLHLQSFYCWKTVEELGMYTKVYEPQKLMLPERSQAQKTDILLYLYEVLRIGKSIDTESRLMVT